MGQERKAAVDNNEIRQKYPREDRAMKAAAGMLGEALISLTDLGFRIQRMVPTEQVVLHVEDFMEDFNYETDDGKILHLEFESDELTKEDLMRFRGYEAVLSYQHKKDVYTCVLCSSKAERLLSEIQTGMNRYSVKVIRLMDWDADKLLDDLEQTQENSHPLNQETLLKLVLLPLMGGNLSQMERIRKGFQILRGEREHREKPELLQLEGVLYILAEKFLDKKELEALKEEIRVTRLGQMLYDDGLKDGRKEGSDEMAALAKVLLASGRMAELQLAIDDKEYREKLMAECRIK